MHIHNQQQFIICHKCLIMKYSILILQHLQKIGFLCFLKEINKKLGDGCFPRNTDAVRATLRFYIRAFFHTNSDPVCLPGGREKCFHVNCVHVQSWKAKLHALVAEAIGIQCLHKRAFTSFTYQPYQTYKFCGLTVMQTNSIK